MTMSFDASPWGAGGFLMVNGVLRSWFTTSFTLIDEHAVGQGFGTCEAQQVAEVLAILFGLRVWLSAWDGKAARLEVRSDSVTALSMMAACSHQALLSGLLPLRLPLSDGLDFAGHLLVLR